MNFKLILILLSLVSTFSLNAQEEKAEEIFKEVEQMPRFYSEECEKVAEKDIEELKACAQREMLNFVYKNVKYPTKAITDGVEGTVVIRFVIGKDGSIQYAESIRNIGGGCEEEALRVVLMMPKWIPGVYEGRAVPVYFNLPVKFDLGKNRKKKKKRG